MRAMISTRFLSVLAALLLWTGSAPLRALAQEREKTQQDVDYRIEAILDEDRRNPPGPSPIPIHPQRFRRSGHALLP